ncbi:MAG TPA: hypothetical protein VM327_06500 [Candidatus Thermoplasmatota archaeon]|nr:hypothetical protein [Candidatus Thermoplasmatota archaeon]
MRSLVPALMPLLVLALALPGCLGHETNASPAASTSSGPAGHDASSSMTSATPAPTTAPGPVLALTGCRNFGGVFPVPMDSARAALPEGFEPVPSQSDPAGGATLYVLGLLCEGSSVDGNDTGEATLAYAELAVIAPTEHRLGGITDGTVPLVFAATPQAVGDALATLRLGQAGFGEVAWVEHTGAGDVIVAVTLGETSFTLRGAYAPGAGTALGSGDFALYGVQDGVLVSKVLGSSAGGQAVDAAVTLEATGLPLLAEARPAARGFSVSGFDLSFRPA